MFMKAITFCFLALSLCVPNYLRAGVGDPQVKTDHPWYQGELACSTFERLAITQAAMFERVVGHPPRSDQDRALAAWMWRNIHYAHGEEGRENLWGDGFRAGDTTTREYWTGLFANGFGLCGTTHAQWSAELNALLGHGRSRTVGVRGHNSFEVYLKGKPYSEGTDDGRWVLLDHDISTIVMDETGTRMLSIDEVRQGLDTLAKASHKPERQNGWPLGGLHPDDPQSFAEFSVVEHLPGYAGPPPMMHLRRGESIRRYFEPGLDDGKQFVYWGRNYRAGGVPGPERSRSWVNQPEKFYGSGASSGYRVGQARYGNAVYTYEPNFADGSYREAVIGETPEHCVFEFQTPYIIGATPADDSDWGIYQPGCRNGLVIHASSDLQVSVSVDRGTHWVAGDWNHGKCDFTDQVKGHRQYWLKVTASIDELRESGLKTVTVCQANPATFPRLKENGCNVEFMASGQAVTSFGPNLAQASPSLIAGAFKTPSLTMELKSPRGERVTRIYAAQHVASSNPPDPSVAYRIERSLDNGASWQSIVNDWRVVRRGHEPADFWSQSFCYGTSEIAGGLGGQVQVRFGNNGGKQILRAEAHAVYQVDRMTDCRVRFAWSDTEREQAIAEKIYRESRTEPWTISTSENVEMKWVEYAAL